MEKLRIAESELILNEDGSIYHLHLLPHQLAETIITVGDPDRVADVSKHFDLIEHKVHHRELVTHTGYLNNVRLSVVSTGMGTDNIDIILNEIDALTNIDFASRTIKDDITSLKIIRVGTSGSVSEEVPIDSILISEIAIGLDNLMNFYSYENNIQETVYLEAFKNHIRSSLKDIHPYIAQGAEDLVAKFENHFPKGTTVTASGFYGPQGRTLRIKNEFPDIIDTLNKFRHKHFKITNLEMETAGIYAIGKVMGHQCLSVNAILANRVNQQFSSNPKRIVDNMIEQVLEIITT
ncbi:MAG: nucleoside phosphorylase [Bacteroidetes bacterium]|nr:nucleoside phosphorylase [Bacteroidota bacterium]